MTEIEFLTPEAPIAPAAGTPAQRRTGGIRRWAAPLAAALLGLAALLAALAPSHLVYEFRLGDGRGGNTYRPDGWGRLPASSGGAGQHGLRYGIVICVAAALFALAAALLVAYRARLADEQDRLRLPLVAGGLGLAAVAALGAVVGEVLLATQSLRDNIEAQLAEQSPLVGRAALTVHLSLGWMVWLVLLAAAAGLVALVLTAVAAGAPRVVTDEPDELPVLEDELVGDDAEVM